MNLLDYLVIALIAGLVILALRSVLRRRKRGGCAGCGSCAGCRKPCEKRKKD